MRNARFTAEELLAATGGTMRNRPVGGAVTFGIYTDSREDGDGDCFLALAGEKFDAHDFLPSAVEHHAGALCVNAAQEGKIPPDCCIPIIIVPDTLHAYQQIAAAHRRRFPGLQVIGVTGSVGKTSVKEMLRAIFSAAVGADRVLYTIGNTNNQIGVPQNLLRLTPAHIYAVLEMGTNHHGEIAPLSRIAGNTIGIVNSIAPCHLEFLGSLNGVAEEKSHIFSDTGSDGTAVIPQECAGSDILSQRAAGRQVLRFGVAPQADIRVELLHGSIFNSSFALTFPDGSRHTVEWTLSGDHQSLNAAAAAAAAWAAGIKPAVIAAALPQTELPGMRMAKMESHGIVFINDAYNANPASMAASLRMLSNASNGKNLILLLGDMLELGEFEQQGHADTLRLARELLPEARIVTIGARMSRAAVDIPCPALHCCATAAEGGVWLQKNARPGDTVFLKASRSMRLEDALHDF